MAQRRTRCDAACTEPRARDVGQRERRGDHDRRERRLRQVLQQSGHEEQDERDGPAPTRPATWVFAPACSATAVREPLVLTGKPWNKPGRHVRRADADHLLVPVDLLDRVRAANADAVEIVSASATNAIRARPAMSRAMSANETRGTSKGGNPCGSAPTTRHAVRRRGRTRSPRRSPARRRPAPREASAPRCSTRIRISATDADGQRGARRSRRWRRPRTNALSSSMKPSASTENPKSFGSWPTRIVRARPFM